MSDRSNSGETFRLTFGDASGPVLLEQAFRQTRMAMCVTDPHEDDNPIVYANRAFLDLTGYEESEVLGRNCRFMQGEGTEEASVQKLRDALVSEEVCIVELLNYRKSGKPFWNALHIGPIYDEHGKLRYFFGSQWDVTNIYAARVTDQKNRAINRELNHRVKNLFAVMSSIVSLSAKKAASAEEAADKARARIAALGRAHEATIDPENSHRGASSTALVSEVVGPFREVGDRVALDGPDVRLALSVVTPLGLALHEMTTNSVKYGHLGGKAESVVVAWGEDSNGFHLDWTEEFDVEQHPSPPGIGSRIMRSLVSSLGGSFAMEADGNRYITKLRLPPSVVASDDAIAQDGVTGRVA